VDGVTDAICAGWSTSSALAAGATGDVSWLGWTTADLPLLLALPVLIVLSGCVSGSETALFSMTEAQRMTLRHRGTFAGKAVDALLADQRHLLVSILLANTTINVLYFVMSSVLIMRSTAGATVQAASAAAFFLFIVLGGEVGPKVGATLHRTRFASAVAAPLLVTHRLLLPITATLRAGVVDPLSRLATATAPPEGLRDEEMVSLLELSEREGVIEADEQRMLRDVLAMTRLTARHVMTPRVRMIALPADASREDVLKLVRETKLTQVPVYEGDLEHITGVLHIKRYLARGGAGAVTDEQFMTEARFIPDLADLEKVLQSFRSWRTQSAIVVDEYGQTEGIISIEDVVEELIGDIATPDDDDVAPPRLIGLGRWMIDGAMSTHAWSEAFGIAVEDLTMATIGGVVVDRLGRPPEGGDVVEIGGARLEVVSAQGAAVVQLMLTCEEEGGAGR
jgi:putative hemolysin